MDELKDQIGEFGSNIEKVARKSGEIELEVKQAKQTLAETKENLEKEINELKQSAVKRDEADKKNQEALDKLIAERLNLVTGQQAQKSFNDLLSEGLKENEDNIRKFARKERKSFDFQLKAVGDMTFSVNFGTASQSVSDFRPGIIQNPARRNHVRELVPKGTMSGSTFYYMKETGDGEGSIATVSEGSTKPQLDFDLIEASAPAEYIAGWVRISTKMLDDIPGMEAFLRTRLLEKLLRVEDTQLISGNGTPPNLSGITDTGNFTAASGAATIDLEQLVQAIAQLAALDRNATGIVLNPADYFSILLNKGATSGDYSLPNIVTVSPTGDLRILGIDVVWTNAMTVDKFIVGDFQQGAMLLQREAPRVEFFYEDGTNVRENKVTVRVEERIAFPIFGDNYFIYGDFGNVA